MTRGRRTPRRLAFAGALATAACNAIVGNDTIHYVDDGDGGFVGRTDGATGPDGATDGAPSDSPTQGDGTTGPDGAILPCSAVDATFCADFDPPTGTAPWGFTTYSISAPPTTRLGLSTTPPQSLEIAAPSGAGNRFVLLDWSDTNHRVWELDLEIAELPTGAATPRVEILVFSCASTENLSLFLDGTVLGLKRSAADGGGATTLTGATLGTGAWKHIRLERDTNTVFVDGKEAFSFAALTCVTTRAFLGFNSSSPAGLAGQWRLLFDSVRIYP